MAILQRIRAALDPSVTLEDLQGEDAFTPLKDLGEQLGGAYGIETPRARRRREELEAEREIQLGMIDGKIGDELDTLLGMDPESESHRAIVSSMADRAMIVSQMVSSQFPEIQEVGFQELTTLLADIHSAGLDVEKRRLEDEALEAAGLKEEWSMMNTVADDLRAESSAFLDQRLAFGTILASAKNPSAAGDLALIFNYMKLLDPGSTVREGEFANAQNSAGVEDRVRSLYNNLLTGERLLPDQRADFVGRSRALYSTAREEQLERNSRYLGRARAGGVRESLLANLALPLDPAESDYLPPAVRERGTQGTLRDVSEFPAGTERVTPGLTATGVGAIFQGAKEIFGETARKIGGIELYRTPDGFLYEVDSDGTMRPAGRETHYETADGRVLELVDHGEGRYEWRVVTEPEPTSSPRGPRRGTIQRPTNGSTMQTGGGF